MKDWNFCPHCGEPLKEETPDAGEETTTDVPGETISAPLTTTWGDSDVPYTITYAEC